MKNKRSFPRFETHFSAPTPGCVPHQHPRGERFKEYLFRKWVSKELHKAMKLYWRLHPGERWW